MKEVEGLCKSPASAVECRNGETFSTMAWWINDFYDLRNKIVHGDPVKPANLLFDGNSAGIAHLQVATAVIGECIWQLLCREKIIGENCKRLAGILRKTGCTTPSYDLVKQHATLYAGSADLWKTLGWLREAGSSSEI